MPKGATACSSCGRTDRRIQRRHPEPVCHACAERDRQRVQRAEVRAAQEREEQLTRAEQSTAVDAEHDRRYNFAAVDLAAPWRRRAACHDKTDLFYPDNPAACGAYDAAKAVCARCPVSAPCLEFAMETERSDGRHGVYGGTTPSERDRISAERTRAATA